jgi:hypothetical protein
VLATPVDAEAKPRSRFKENEVARATLPAYDSGARRSA